MKLFSDCTTVEDWVEYYKDAYRDELKNAYIYLTEYGTMTESEENRLQAIKTLMSETNDWRYFD